MNHTPARVPALLRALASTALRLLFLSLLPALLVLPAQAQDQPGISAFVSQDRVSLNDVITLTIRVDTRLGDARPVLSGLDEDFLQLGVATENQYTNLNGNLQSWTAYHISIKPKNTGTLVIPSFRVGGEATRPITIEVDQPAQDGGYEDIFLRTEVSKDEVYVQEQLLFTIKIYYAVNFNQGAQLSTPQVDNAVVQQLGSDESYQELVDGLSYNVVERKFVIFPQGSGQLSIPPVYFTAQVGGRGINLLRQRNTRQISLGSDTHQVQVKAVPADFPGATWLPASRLRISEELSGGDELSVGESVTRNLTLRAEGLSSSLLPAIEYQDIPGLKFYPDQPEREDRMSREGITGIRSEGTAIVPSESGEYLLPEIRLPWWNTTTDQLEYASIPARSLEVLPGAAVNRPEPAQLNFGPQEPAFSPADGPASGGAGLNTLWIVATAVFAAAWLFTTTLWLRGRRQLAYAGRFRGPMPVPAAGRAVDQTLPDREAAFRHLQQACRDNDLRELKRAVVHWGQAHFGNRNIRTLDHLRGYCGNPTLAALLFNLEQALYSEHEPRDFRCAQLLREVGMLHKSGRRPGKAGADYQLPPLYRN